MKIPKIITELCNRTGKIKNQKEKKNIFYREKLLELPRQFIFQRRWKKVNILSPGKLYLSLKGKTLKILLKRTIEDYMILEKGY